MEINALKITFHLQMYEETPPFGNVCVCVNTVLRMLQTLNGITFSLKERKRIGGVKGNEKQRETLKGQTSHDLDAAGERKAEGSGR